VGDVMLEQADHRKAGLWCVALPAFNPQSLSVGKFYTLPADPRFPAADES
jgi:hypothetical protein